MHLTLRIFCDILILQCDLQVTNMFDMLIAIRNAILTDLMLFFADIAFPLSNNIKRKRVVSHETTLYFVAEHYNYL